MKRRPLLVAIIMFCAALAMARASSTDDAFCAAIKARYGAGMKYYTIVPYKNKYFGLCCDTSQANRNNNGRKPHLAVWETANGRWSWIFDFYAEVDADDGAIALNRLFARYQFSPSMRQKLMYGTERSVY